MFAFFVDSFVVLLIIIGAVLVVTQIAMPTFRGGILFPAFRKRSRELQQTIEELKTEIHLLNREKEVESLREQVHPKHTESEGDGGANAAAKAAAANILVDVVAFMKP